MLRRALVAGGGGFIGGHLVGDLLSRGVEVRSVDIKPLERWYQLDRRAENLRLALDLYKSLMPSLAFGSTSARIQRSKRVQDIAEISVMIRRGTDPAKAVQQVIQQRQAVSDARSQTQKDIQDLADELK